MTPRTHVRSLLITVSLDISDLTNSLPSAGVGLFSRFTKVKCVFLELDPRGRSGFWAN